jgi:hypothetical protein
MKNLMLSLAFVALVPVTGARAESHELPIGCTWSQAPVEYQEPDGKTFSTHIECAGPGTGSCWKRGHDPRKGEAPLSTENWGEC